MDTLPAPVDTGSQESVASQVTTQAADQSQDEGRISLKNPDHPLAAKPAGNEAEATLETASEETQSQEISTGIIVLQSEMVLSVVIRTEPIIPV